MTPQPAERACWMAAGSKKTSVALLGTRSTLVPSARHGRNELTAWPGVVSTRMVAIAGAAPEATAAAGGAQPCVDGAMVSAAAKRSGRAVTSERWDITLAGSTAPRR